MAHQTIHIRVTDIIGNHAMTAAAGHQLYHHIQATVEAGERIELDFDEVKVITPLFVSATLGSFLQWVDPATFKNQVKMLNLHVVMQRMVERVMDDLYRLHHDPSYREALRGVRHYKMSEGGYSMDTEYED